MDIVECYKQAWRGFSRWWIPLCLVAFVAVAADLLPRLLAQQDVDQTSITTDFFAMLDAAQKDDPREVQRRMNSLKSTTLSFVQATGRYTLYLLPIALPIAVMLIVFGMKASSKEGLSLKEDTKRVGRRGLSVLLTQVFAMVVTFSPFFVVVAILLAFRGKFQGTTPLIALSAALIAMFLFFLGFMVAAFFYILFFFAPQLAADEELGPLQSMLKSQRMVRRSFVMVFLLVLINSSIQGLLGLTIVGLIPGTAFANTARGAAYYQLLEMENAALGDGPPTLEEPVAETANDAQVNTESPEAKVDADSTPT